MQTDDGAKAVENFVEELLDEAFPDSETDEDGEAMVEPDSEAEEYDEPDTLQILAWADGRREGRKDVREALAHRKNDRGYGRPQQRPKDAAPKRGRDARGKRVPGNGKRISRKELYWPRPAASNATGWATRRLIVKTKETPNQHRHSREPVGASSKREKGLNARVLQSPRRGQNQKVSRGHSRPRS